MGVTDANIVHSIANALPPGTNNIGDVDVASFPAISVLRASGGSIAAATGMEFATDSRQGTYNAVTTAALTWTGSNETRWFRVPMGSIGYRSCELSLTNLLGVDATFTVYPWITGGTWSTDQAKIWSSVRPTGGGITIFQSPPGDGSSAAGYCGTLTRVNTTYLVVEIIPASTATGTAQLVFARGT